MDFRRRMVGGAIAYVCGIFGGLALTSPDLGVGIATISASLVAALVVTQIASRKAK